MDTMSNKRYVYLDKAFVDKHDDDDDKNTEDDEKNDNDEDDEKANQHFCPLLHKSSSAVD